MKVVVVGGGKMGLPLACQFADNGAEVTVCDINAALVSQINLGKAPFEEPGLSEALSRTVQRQRLKATTDTRGAVGTAAVVVIIVPALLTPERTVDYTNLKAASKSVASGLKAGTLVSYETTVPVGGVRAHLAPILEESGLKAGKDFYVAFSPERVKSQHVFEHLQKTPKVVGGFDTASAGVAETFYRRYLGASIFNVGAMESAEFVKLAGMLYRDVNIALANELAGFCEKMGIDYGACIDACNTDGEAFLLKPGIGVGGHCTPVYPYFMTKAAEQMAAPLRLADYARFINEEQPLRHIQRLEKTLGTLSGKRVHLLGLGFRPEVKEHAYSPAFVLRDELESRGAKVTIEDPWYGEEELKACGFEVGDCSLNSCDAIVLNTAHKKFLSLDFKIWKSLGVQVLLDGRNCWNANSAEAAGLTYLGVGTADKAVAPESEIPITKPLLGGSEARAADGVVRSLWVAQGPKVAEFEQSMKVACGTTHAVAVANGTAALHLALLALDVRPGDEVICPSLSFIATANSIRHAGAIPVFAEVDPMTYNLDPDAAEAKITSRTKAIMVVHQVGLPADLERFIALGKKYDLKIIEDAACALGSLYRGKPIGGHTEMACFSFHPRKILTTGEGGVITTNSPVYAEKLLLLRQHGAKFKSSANPAEAREHYLSVGYNFRMTDLQAAIGIEQLKRLDWVLERRREIAARYAEVLEGHPWLSAPYVPKYVVHNFQSYTVGLKPTAPFTQSEFLDYLRELKIFGRSGIMLSHLEAPYVGSPAMPQSECASARSVLIPIYPQMTPKEQDRVIASLSIASLKRKFGSRKGSGASDCRSPEVFA